MTGIFRSMKIEVGRLGLHGLDRLLAVGRLADVELPDLPQAVDEDATVVLVVLDDQNLLQRHPIHSPRVSDAYPCASSSMHARSCAVSNLRALCRRGVKNLTCGTPSH